jgi:hypothetical protein
MEKPILVSNVLKELNNYLKVWQRIADSFIEIYITAWNNDLVKKLSISATYQLRIRRARLSLRCKSSIIEEQFWRLFLWQQGTTCWLELCFCPCFLWNTIWEIEVNILYINTLKPGLGINIAGGGRGGGDCPLNQSCVKSQHQL